VGGFLKGFVVGALVCAAGLLLHNEVTDDGSSVPQQISDALGCSSPASQTAAYAHRGPGYSLFAASHADRILGIGGCETGPATMYLRFGSSIELRHALATLKGYGPLCVLDNAIFEGRVLSSRNELEELCAKVGGAVKVF
jgi:hypothetical protein